MYVCVDIYVIYICVCIYGSMYECMDACMHGWMSICLSVCLYVRMYVCMYVQYVSVCVYIYIYTYGSFLKWGVPPNHPSHAWPWLSIETPGDDWGSPISSADSEAPVPLASPERRRSDRALGNSHRWAFWTNWSQQELKLSTHSWVYNYYILL